MKLDVKKLTTIGLLLLGSLLVFFALSFTLFAPKSFELNFLTSTHVLTHSQQEILEEIDIKGSVFFFNRKTAKNQLESAFPHLKVVGFEIVFPSKVVVHSAEREGLFAVNLTPFSCAIVDEDLKVLSKTSNFTSTSNNEILLDIRVVNTSAKEGEFLDVSNPLEKQVVKSLKNAFLRNNRSVSQAKASFREISFENEVIEGTSVDSLQLVVQDFLGFSTTLYQIDVKCPEKLECYFRSKSSLSPQDLLSKAMVVIETTDRGIVPVLVD